MYIAPETARRSIAITISALLLVAAVSVVAPSTASAAPGSFTVDDPVDAPDAAIDGVCQTASGTCSLRAAVQEAINRGGTSEVHFAAVADTSALSLGGAGGPEIGDLDIPFGVTVQLIGNVAGPGATTMIKADALGDRHFHVFAGGRLEIQSVQLVAGSTPGDGGAILNEGSVLVSNSPSSEGAYVAISNSTAGGVGGAIANRPGADLGISNISSSASGSRVDLSSNIATVGGGAIANDAGTVTIKGSTGSSSHDVYLDNNSTPVHGGGVLNAGGGSVLLGCRAYVRFSSAASGGDVYNEKGQVTLVGGGIDGGSAVDGGGLYNADAGTFTVAADSGCQNSGEVMRSTASNHGGGIFNRGSILVKADARLSVRGAGTGGDARSGGGVYLETGDLTVDGALDVDDTVAADDGGAVAMTGGSFSTGGDGLVRAVKTGAGRDGGGVSVSGGVMKARVVLDSNAAGGGGGGLSVVGSGSVDLVDSAIVSNVAAHGGGVSVENASASLVNTTIARNSSTSVGGGVEADGGAVTLRHDTVVDNAPDGLWSSNNPSLQRVLMARNSGHSCSGNAKSSGDFNVVDDGSCSPTGSDLSDPSRFGDVADLLQDDSTDGDPLFYGLDIGHPAIDFVTDGGCGNPDHDQRGLTRPVDGDGVDGEACDAGAIEVSPSVAPQTISGTVRDEVTGDPIGGVCVYATDLNGGGGGGDGVMVMTDDDGTYTSGVFDGDFLMAFFVPAGHVTSPKGCGESGFDTDYQPEWYRNVPVEFKDDGDGDVEFPDIDDITSVPVDGADVTGIDVCLGAGPGAGLDAPCDEGAAGPDDAGTPTTVMPSAPYSPGGDTAGAANSRSGTTVGARLAFTGGALGGLWLGAVLLLAGFGLAESGRRRRPARSQSSHARR